MRDLFIIIIILFLWNLFHWIRFKKIIKECEVELDSVQFRLNRINDLLEKKEM